MVGSDGAVQVSKPACAPLLRVTADEVCGAGVAAASGGMVGTAVGNAAGDGFRLPTAGAGGGFGMGDGLPDGLSAGGLGAGGLGAVGDLTAGLGLGLLRATSLTARLGLA